MKLIDNIYYFIIGICRKLLKILDKLIIVPTTKLILLISERTGHNGKTFEKWLTKKSTLVFVSLILALFFFFLVDSKKITLVESSAEVLYNKKVEAIYNKEAYVIEGLPDEVDVILIGRRADLFLAKQLSSKNITVDMSGLGLGTHKVSLTYENSITSIVTKVDPSTANITVYPKLSETRTVNVDVINKDKIDPKLDVSTVDIDKKEIVIKGAEHKLEKVSTVKALVDVSNIVNPAIGVTSLKNIPLVAYDNKGNVVDVEMVPNQVSANISIISPSKEVPIKVIPKGVPEFGKAISAISSTITKVTVYGDEDVINNIQYVPVSIDVTGLKETKEYSVVLSKPTGIRFISETSTVVKISLDVETTIEIEDVQIESINVDPNYKASALSKEDSTTSIIIKGTKSVLDTLDQANIKAIVDLSGLAVGDHEVEVTVSGDEVKVTYTPKKTKVKIRISKK